MEKEIYWKGDKSIWPLDDLIRLMADFRPVSLGGHIKYKSSIFGFR